MYKNTIENEAISTYTNIYLYKLVILLQASSFYLVFVIFFLYFLVSLFHSPIHSLFHFLSLTYTFDIFSHLKIICDSYAAAAFFRVLIFMKFFNKHDSNNLKKEKEGKKSNATVLHEEHAFMCMWHYHLFLL